MSRRRQSVTFLILPLYTKAVLEATGATLGLLEGALWLGMLLGAFSDKRLPGHPGRVGAGCLPLFGAALAVPGLVSHQGIVLGCLALAGWAVGVTNVVFVTLFQRTVPTTAKPAFFTALLALLGTSFPLAALVFGVLGDLVSPSTLCLVQTAGLLPIALALLVRATGTHEITTAA
ncbi:hypothetical protein AB0O76_37140 [Streptomyces sp. NPDC086554]|uniref:hypothetical protein n=1 Tax=Streptomyces sp. NPDC086554 TaxID=3154864 RepID=UPI00342D2227